MVSIPPLPAIAGILCGLSLYPLFRSIVKAAKKRVALRQEEMRLKETSFILSGTFEDNQFVASIETLIKQKRQGVLHLFLGRRKGYLLFRDGSVIDVYYRNVSGKEALKQLLKEQEGEYFFESRAVYQPQMLFEPIMELISELEK